MTRRELHLQKKIKRAIEDAGGAARIVVQTAYTTVGDPDLYACLNGHFLQIEVKDGWGYTVQPIQKRRLREWAGAGALAVVVRNMADANFLIKQLTKVDLYGRNQKLLPQKCHRRSKKSTRH